MVAGLLNFRLFGVLQAMFNIKHRDNIVIVLITL